MHALVIGGTGMLADLSVWLTETYQVVTVVGRDWKRLRKLVEKAGSHSDQIVPISIDYSNPEVFKDAIRRDMWRNGPLRLCVAWVRSAARDSLESVAWEISEHSNEKWKLFHLVGTQDANDAKKLHLPPSAEYRRVNLGFKIEGRTSRWLTDEEIWNGTRDAIVSDSRDTALGVLHPREMMPS